MVRQLHKPRAPTETPTQRRYVITVLMSTEHRHCTGSAPWASVQPCSPPVSVLPLTRVTTTLSAECFSVRVRITVEPCSQEGRRAVATL